MRPMLWGVLALLCGPPLLHAEPIPAYSQAVEPWADPATGDGLAPRYLRWLAKQAGLALRMEVRPLARVAEDLKSGRNALSLLTALPQRDAFALELCQPVSIRLSLLYRQSGPALAANGLKGKVVGTLRGSHSLDAFLARCGARAEPLPDMPQGMRMLRAGRLAATVCVRPGCQHALAEVSEAGDRWAELPVDDKPMAVYVSRAHPLAHDAAALARLRAACVSPEGKRVVAELLSQYD
ncbi:substrate-binding periplasmic protein [Chromobacterium alticapitis]|uniref:Uncharacterized protein n=1 Tax=Chromobacterium alticapitis TaxID=2073169 RepID=A0A2S5DE96_9NEIS|nr:transporter substrate-binding domain-containing protein [Chromobacterium alticapitis]POZ61321.1 hypothetical protein C2I19_14300 [Chromobacterium alticapitis]